MALYIPRSSGLVPLPYSFGLPFPLSQVSLAYPVCSLFPAVSSLVSWKDTLAGCEGSQHLGCSSFSSPYFGPLLLISCKLRCITPLPQFQLLLFYWSFVLSREYLLTILGFSYFQISQTLLLPSPSLHKNADIMQVFEPSTVSTYTNFGVCGAILFPRFVTGVHKFLVLLSQLLYFCLFVCLFCFVFNEGIQGRLKKNTTAIFPELFSLNSLHNANQWNRTVRSN